MSDDTIASLLLVVRLGLITVLVWLCSRGWEIWRDFDKRAKDKAAYIRALYAEIEFNTADMVRFLETAPPLSIFEDLFNDPEYVPHITDARHTEVYRARITDLSILSDDLIGDTVRFYGDLEKVRNQIEGLLKRSFTVISKRGKLGTLENIYKSCRASEALGHEILTKMEAEYGSLRLTRRTRRMSPKPLKALG